MRQGDFSALSAAVFDPLATARAPFPGNIIPSNRLSPQSTFYLPFYPTANAAGNTFNFAPSLQNTPNKFDIRVDHYFSPTDSLTSSSSLNGVVTYTPGQFAANGGVTNTVRRQQFSLSETHSFTPAVLNELRLGYVRTAFYNYPQGLGTNYTVQSGIGGFADQSGAFPGFP